MPVKPPVDHVICAVTRSSERARTDGGCSPRNDFSRRSSSPGTTGTGVTVAQPSASGAAGTVPDDALDAPQFVRGSSRLAGPPNSAVTFGWNCVPGGKPAPVASKTNRTPPAPGGRSQLAVVGPVYGPQSGAVTHASPSQYSTVSVEPAGTSVERTDVAEKW